MTIAPANLLMLLAFAMLLACGQMLFKLSAATLPPLVSISALMAILTNMWFWLALALYGGATLLWIAILQQVPLSLAYPFVALGFIIIPLASWLLFKEPLNLPYAAGVGLIIMGIGVITVMAPQ